VLDGELAVPCNPKSAICGVEFQFEGFAEFNFFIKAMLKFSALRNIYYLKSARSGKKQR